MSWFGFSINGYQFKEDCNTEKKIASKLKSFSERSLLQNEDNIRHELFDILQVEFFIKISQCFILFYTSKTFLVVINLC